MSKTTAMGSSGVTPNLFPKGPFGVRTWTGLALGSDHFHICGFTPINCPSERKNLRTDSSWENQSDTFTHKSVFTELKAIYPRIKWESFIFGLH